ncbi:MAG: saccharopine dehydrogenase C-terminal domain-containing protein [bacterium]|nr:saccharopine dehydrogenase C-terminal domain-containing protein [bacterium]
MKQRRYAVLGAGRQGKAAAYDLARFGNAGEVIIGDKDAYAAASAEVELNGLLGEKVVRSIRIDVSDLIEVRRTLYDVDGLVSAVHYGLNIALSKLAIDAGCHMVDLGGNTAVVLKQHEFHRQAASAGVSIVPDCGMAPGFNVNLACYALGQIAYPRELTIYCGGIPQKPKPPLGYHFPFALSGLVNECSGYADIIQRGKIAKQSCLESIESVQIPEVGMLEAMHTSGGLSTAPWTLNGKYPTLETLEYQTLRYPGHWNILRDLAWDGELESGLKEFERLERASPHDPEDFGIVSVRCSGLTAEGKLTTVILEVVDCYDHDTGFTAMQRLTGFHASIMLIAATETLQGGGVLHVESFDPQMVVCEFAKRGVVVDETHATQA